MDCAVEDRGDSARTGLGSCAIAVEFDIDEDSVDFEFMCKVPRDGLCPRARSRRPNEVVGG
jgi:hypothetical protein